MEAIKIISICLDFCTWRSHTEDVEVVKEAGLGASGVGVAEQAVQETSSEEVTENAIGLGLLLGVAAGDIAGGALALGTVHGGRLRQLGADDNRGHAEGEGSGSDELHFDG